MTPLEFTVATLELLDLYVIFSTLVNGFRTGFKVYLCPFIRVILLATPIIFVVFTAPFCTVTVIFFLNPLFNVTVITALPVFFPAVIVHVPFDFPDTFTTLVLLDFQETIESPLL